MRRTAMGTQTASQRTMPTAGTGEVDVEEARSGGNVGEAEASEKRDNFFTLKSSTFSVWLPSVVGNITHFRHMFLISSLSSLAAKVVTLAMAVVLAAAGLQGKIQPNHFLVLCRDNSSLNNDTDIVYCTSWEDCFTYTDNLQQKFRICNDSETAFRLYLFLGLTVSTLLAILATYKLHKISDYKKLFQDSKSFLLLPTQPVVHRKLLLDTVAENNTTLLEDILTSHTRKTTYDYMVSMMAWLKNICSRGEEAVNIETLVKADFVDRADPKGNTALHISCIKGYSECTKKLITAGANVNIPDPSNNTALKLACINGFDKCTQLLLQAKATFYSNSKGVKHAIYGEDPSQANVNHLTEWQDKPGVKHSAKFLL